MGVHFLSLTLVVLLHVDILSSKRLHIFCIHYPSASENKHSDRTRKVDLCHHIILFFCWEGHLCVHIYIVVRLARPYLLSAALALG
jgi:hypothetical protein